MDKKDIKPMIEKSYLLDNTLKLDFWFRYCVTEDYSTLVHDDGTKHYIKGDHTKVILDLVGNKNGRYPECLTYFNQQPLINIEKGTKNAKSTTHSV